MRAALGMRAGWVGRVSSVMGSANKKGVTTERIQSADSIVTPLSCLPERLRRE